MQVAGAECLSRSLVFLGDCRSVSNHQSVIHFKPFRSHSISAPNEAERETKHDQISKSSDAGIDVVTVKNWVTREELFLQFQLPTNQSQMGSIVIIKPLSTVLGSAVNRSQQHQEKNSGNFENRTLGCWGQKNFRP